MLESKYAYRRLIAVRVLANLTRIDDEARFDEVFDKYFTLLNDSVIVAGHFAADSGKIVKAKPTLQTKITAKLLNIDATNRVIDNFLHLFLVDCVKIPHDHRIVTEWEFFLRMAEEFNH